MLHLHSSTSDDWLGRVKAQLDDVLIDHAHCERKAAGTAMSLISAYVEKVEFVLALEPIVVEELEHFRLVLEILERRSIRFRRQKPSSYGRRLQELVCRQEPQRAVDRCLVAALIEARSCERFALLRDSLSDGELARFYGELFDSEARHHATYVRLAEHFAPESKVAARLDELAARESEIIAEGDALARMHS